MHAPQAANSLRLYANLWRHALAITLMVADIAFGFWCLQTSRDLVVFGYAVLIVCCPLLAFYLALFVVRGVLRYPVLAIDSREWCGWASPFSAPQVIAWPDIAAVGVTRQKGRSMYRLAVYLKTPNRTPSQRMVGQNPTSPGITFPLNELFLGLSPKDGEALLNSIYARFRNEFERYGVQVVPPEQHGDAQ